MFPVHVKISTSYFLPALSLPWHRLTLWLLGKGWCGAPVLMSCPLALPLSLIPLVLERGGRRQKRYYILWPTHSKLTILSLIDFFLRILAHVTGKWVAILLNVIASLFNTDWPWVWRVGPEFKWWFFPEGHLLGLWMAFQDVFTITLSTIFVLL